MAQIKNIGDGLAIVRGSITDDGAKNEGDGFTVTDNGPGDYTINFDTEFSGPPSVIFSVDAGTGSAVADIRMSECTASVARLLATAPGGGSQDTPISFIAVGATA